MRASFGCLIGILGLGLAQARTLEPFRIVPIAGAEGRNDGCGAPHGEIEVVLLVADTVGLVVYGQSSVQMRSQGTGNPGSAARYPTHRSVSRGRNATKNGELRGKRLGKTQG